MDGGPGLFCLPTTQGPQYPGESMKPPLTANLAATRIGVVRENVTHDIGMFLSPDSERQMPCENMATSLTGPPAPLSSGG